MSSLTSPVPARCGRPALITDSELVALAVCQAAIGASSDRQFLGLVGRIAQRILALTLGILLNTLNGRPARALAAYDGR